MKKTRVAFCTKISAKRHIPVLKSYHFRSWLLLLPLKAEEQSQIGLKNADSKFQMVDLFTGDDGQKVMTIPHMTHDPLGQRATNIRQQQTIIISKHKQDEL